MKMIIDNFQHKLIKWGFSQVSTSIVDKFEVLKDYFKGTLFNSFYPDFPLL